MQTRENNKDSITLLKQIFMSENISSASSSGLNIQLAKGR